MDKTILVKKMNNRTIETAVTGQKNGIII